MDRLDPDVVAQLFAELIELPVAKRAQELERRAGGDTLLRREVASLLAADDSAGEFLSSTTAVRELARAAEREQALAAADPLEPGATVGAWRLIEVIGTGGMGRVWRAERADAAFRQLSALKVVKRGMDSEEIVARFAQERQTLAQLEHPYIARLLDGGVTPDGRPFLAMELVDGERLDDWTRRAPRPLAERLAVFQKVCRAVEHAHQRLVIHRDLKPGNILVNGDGDPKLLDFGIAKVLAAGTASSELTAADARLFTVDYASPEQVAGDPITTASDVYSLGLVLHELLSGERAFDLRNKPLTEVARIVREVDATRPSERAGLDAATRKALRGDLDAIVLQALRKEPERRYASVAELREDVERHLRSLPVRAAADSTRYVVGRFVRRHRLECAFAAVAVLALAVGLAVSLRQTARANALAADLSHELEQTDEALRFFSQAIGAGDMVLGKGPHTTLREILEAATGRLLARRNFAPEVESRVRESLALAWMACDDKPRARRELARVVALLDQMGVPEDDDRAFRVRRRLLVLDVALGDREERVALLAELEALVDRYAAPRGPDHRRVIEARCDVCATLCKVGQVRRAAEMARSIEAAVIAQGEDAGDDWLAVVGPTNLANALFFCGETEAALPIARIAVQRAERAAGPTHDFTLNALHNLASIESQLGKLDEAEARFVRLVALRREHFGERHDDTLAAIADLAVVYSRQKKPEKALELQQQMLEAQRDADGRLSYGGAITLGNRVNSLRNLGRHDEALDALDEYLREAARLFDPGSIADAYKELIAGATYFEAGELGLVEERLAAALKAFRAIEGEHGAKEREVAAWYAKLRREQGDEDDAARWDELAKPPPADG